MDRLAKISVILAVLLFSGVAQGLVIDFDGGTAYLSDGTSVTTSDTMTPYYYWNVDYYIEDGVRFDFIGDTGTVGRYYDAFGHPEIENSVVHSHWGTLTAMEITMVDGSAFDLNYLDLSSNTVVGGGAATGGEVSYITSDSGHSELLPSSDWGLDYLSNGTTPGDGIERLWLGSEFDSVLSVTFTSENAYCFGLDNFYINEPPPEPIPEPSPLMLMIIGLTGLILGTRIRLAR